MRRILLLVVMLAAGLCQACQDADEATGANNDSLLRSARGGHHTEHKIGNSQCCKDTG